MFAFYQLNRTKRAGLFADLGDLAEWLDLFEGLDGTIATAEVECADGVFEVVLCDGRPVGTIAHAAPASLLAALAEPATLSLAA